MNRYTRKRMIFVLAALLIAIGSIAVYFYAFNKDDATDSHSHTTEETLWTCTMHPQVIADKPGQCPICGMDLVPKVTKEKPADDMEDMSGMLEISDRRLALANVSTVRVEYADLRKEIAAFSYLEFPDESRKVIAAKFNGRIEKLFAANTGDHVKAGLALFTFYSPDIVQAQNDLLLAIKNGADNALLNAARRKLQIFGLTQKQIAAIENSREAQLTLTYFSPLSGVVLDKKAQEGMYFNEGTSLFEVVDLSTLWNIAEIFEKDLNAVSVGSAVRVTFPSFPGEVFNGRVSYVYPNVSLQTRTIKIRSSIANRNGRLRAQMYGESKFARSFGRGLVVPAESILFTGKRNVVWVKAGDGMFEPRDVAVGMRIGDNYQILSGLKAGEEIAKTGGFLIDSESQLKTGSATGHQHGDEAPEQAPPPADEHEGHGR